MKLRRERVLDRRGRKSWLITTVLLMFASVSFLLTFPPTAVHGDTVALTIQAGISPSGVAVNPSTGRIYVANRGDGTISVIDSATKIVVGTITVGDIPAELAVNPATNRLYLTYSDNNITTVIDGSTGQVVGNIAVPQNVKAIAVNSVTNTIYLTGGGSSGSVPGSRLFVVSGSNNTVLRTIAIGSGPFSIAVNPNSNRVYVANFYDWTISVVDGSLKSVISTVPVNGAPNGLAVNPGTNRLYVNDVTHNTLLVLDASTYAILAQVPVGSFPNAVDLNPKTNRVYVVNSGGGSVTIVDGNTNAVVSLLKVGNFPPRVAADPVTNFAYVTNQNSDSVTVIYGGPPTTSRVTVATQDSGGASISGFYISVLNQGGKAVASGFSTASFRVNNSQPYTVVVQDFGNYFFDHWLDTGSTNRYRSITITTNTTITAVYTNANSPPPGYSSISVKTVNSAGAPLNGYLTTLSQNGTVISQYFSPSIFTVANGQTYQVSVADYQGETFSHWSDGTTSRVYTVIIGGTSTAVNLTAVYTP